jgi:hypothetical protein
MKKNIFINNGPEGKNGLTSRAAFVQRVVYEFNYNQVKTFVDNTIDMRTSYIDFLKYDLNNDVVNISETRLKNIDTDIYVVDIVADAFSDLKRLSANNNQITDEIFKDLQPKKGWSSLHKKYHDYMTKIFEDFVSNVTASSRNKKIINFEDFIFSFIHFLDNLIYKTPFLKSSYFLSRECPITDTGFSIEIDTIKKDKDKDKFTKYYESNSFIEFAKLAKNTNFVIDKDCPWRLIYNLYSETSDKYLNKYNLDLTNFSDKYFYKTQTFDIENIKQYMIIFYNTFVTRQPTAFNPKIINYNNKQFTVSNITDRSPIVKETIEAKFKPLFWFIIYTHISLVENKVSLNDGQYRTLLKQLSQIHKVKGQDAAMTELNNFILSSTKTVTRGQYNFTIPDLTS